MRYPYCLEQPIYPLDETGLKWRAQRYPFCPRDAFGFSLVKAGKKYENVVVVSCDLKGATRTRFFFDKFPTRSIEIGIAEANGIGIAAGLALAGYRPFISSFGAFITGKNLEIRTSIAYNKASVVVVGTHGALIGPDGATHCGLQDVAVMRGMPNFILLQPASGIETEAMVDYLAGSRSPAYLRLARNELPEIYSKRYRFRLGKGYVLMDGTDVTVIASGPPVHAALEAAGRLTNFMSVRVVNIPSLKPIDAALILRCATETRGILTVEDHSIEGGLGSIVSEIVAGSGLGTSVYRHGIRDVFTESGTLTELEKKYQLDAEGVTHHLKCFYESLRVAASSDARLKTD